MKKFLRIVKQNTIKERKQNVNLELYEKDVNLTGMYLVLKLLKEVNDEVHHQPCLKSNIQLLAEKSIGKIDVKNVVTEKHTSYQHLEYEYEACLRTCEIWHVITEFFIDYTLYVTEAEFRQVAAILSNYLKKCCKEEENFFTTVSKRYINIRDDGQIEIVFPAKIWGDKQLTSEMIQNAENAGVCFVEINSSPIYRKAVLPYGWNISKNKTWDGFRFIIDEEGQKRGEFRLKRLPNNINNGEFDFFFDECPMKIEEKTMSILLGKNDSIIIKQNS